MNDRRDLISMLDDSGSLRIHHKSHHIHYKLPNGKILVLSSTPSDHRSHANAIALLRRELRPTHPHIAERRSSTLPKNKRRTTNLLGDMIAAKGPIPFTAAIPGSMATPLPEAEFELLPPEPLPAPAPEPEMLHLPIPRKPQAERVLPPGKARTLAPEQLTEANRVLHAEGESAMNFYLNQCRNGLVPATSKLIAERTPIAPEHRVPSTPTHDEDLEMASVLERARTELHATTTRITHYESQITQMTSDRDMDILRQGELEQYIVEHETLASKAAKLMAEILPPVKPEPPPPPPKPATTHKVGRPTGSPTKNPWPKLSFTVDLLRNTVFPSMYNAGIFEFTTDDAITGIEACKLPGAKPVRAQIQNWISLEMKKATAQIRPAGTPGRYRFIASVMEPADA